ncbi:Structural maintenance of chromosomes protein [Wickerhamomyces ciferrii]|uniref:Structural maintenance of chromosomes protein n=1 Tax=Wickerhamomyces ciferrii (strain ATCC 14091 / BCRC 22168 / CBS 111 / JCM 3599 / NBRC 0793 / NRRL Y-1031 F-60-10) TaxID=1206466 RepID=K0KT59_WICCF|nr:Structural maintenance of chromosomes protein [Wickerhamomyces ciferrii]CCH46336.1 Structural maintenance of chromosomes protein [Wickerhamomyces ciferrii]
MHIKKIVIQGFKTFKNTTVIDNLSPSHNVVVGRNGSGKSNFFAAIRFVLSDQYTRMSKEERQGLIHEGSGTVLSAYVEIVFDNSEGRFPTGKDEVVIRRTIGLKKDDYSLDYKSSTRQDIMQLLESAGFSKSNPYYIVPQGRITSLTNAKDVERLNLLKEVAGAKVFENKLKESTKEMSKTKNQRDKIDEMLEFIEERLSDLDSEKEELKNFQNLEKDKKIYEFVLYDRELNEISNSIEQIESEYQNGVDESQNFVLELEKRETLISEIESDIDSAKQSLKLLNIDRNEHSENFEEVSKKIYDINANLVEIRNNLNKYNKTQTNIEKQIKIAKEKIKSHESKVSEKQPYVSKLKNQEAQLDTQLSNLKTKQNLLYSKQNRFSKFNSVEERNHWLNNQIQDLSGRKQGSINQINSGTQRLTELSNKIQNLEASITQLQDSINGDSAQEETNKIENQLMELRRQLSMENDSRKTLWKDEARFKAILESLEDELRKATRQVSQTMDRQQSQGLEAVKRITSRLGLTGVYGPLGELIEVNDKYRTAVEVVAGNSLFHVVVDNDETASTLMDELVRERAGRITFVPLNRVRPQDVTYPDSNDCVPLIKKIGFDPEIENAVKQTFGKSIVAINLERGYELSRQYKLNAITLDGDKADKKGVLTGGYHDFKKSRLESMKIKQDKFKELRDEEKGLFQVKTEITRKDQLILKINDNMKKVSNELENLHSSKQPLKSKLSNLLNEKFKANDEIKLLKDQLVQLENSKTNLTTKIEQLQNELNSNFEEGLSSQEKIEISNLSKQISELEIRYNKVADELLTHDTELNNLIVELEEELVPRYNELVKEQEKTNQGSLDNDLQNLSQDLENLEEHKASVYEELKKVERHIKDTETHLKKKEEALDKANDQQRKLIRNVENFQKSSEKYLSKKSLLSSRREETQRKIRELGALPEEAFQEFENLSSGQLLQKLNKVTKNLEKFSHVNKKALEQYLSFTKQRDGLVDRRKELTKSESSIDDLINVLETRKDEAIQRTFQQVSASFTEVFEKLVPRGIGKLIMQQRDKNAPSSQAVDEDGDVEIDEDEENGDSIIDNYSGISIQVSFNSKEDEQQRIEQLSGGQKSLCAIALILAIQKSDPAPFYLFDEIDANLDTQYRTAVANMIHELSQNAQFICTTFRPEMLQVASKFFGVMFNNKISTVSEINRSDALGFVEGQQQRA